MNTLRNSQLNEVLIQDPAAEGAKTLAGFYAAFQAWKTANPDAIPQFAIDVMGGDGVPALIIYYS